MSRIIVAEKALEIVRNCCSEVNPASATIQAIERYISTVGDEIARKLIPPMEAGIGTIPGLSPDAAKTLIVTAISRRLALPVVLRPRIEKMTLPVLDAWNLALTLKGIQDKLRTMNFCEDLLSCVARGFRGEILPSRTEKRKRYVEKGFVTHFIVKGTKIPKQAIRTARP